MASSLAVAPPLNVKKRVRLMAEDGSAEYERAGGGDPMDTSYLQLLDEEGLDGQDEEAEEAEVGCTVVLAPGERACTHAPPWTPHTHTCHAAAHHAPGRSGEVHASPGARGAVASWCMHACVHA